MEEVMSSQHSKGQKTQDDRYSNPNPAPHAHTSGNAYNQSGKGSSSRTAPDQEPFKNAGNTPEHAPRASKQGV
jgi:hypothetical protein